VTDSLFVVYIIVGIAVVGIAAVVFHRLYTGPQFGRITHPQTVVPSIAALVAATVIAIAIVGPTVTAPDGSETSTGVHNHNTRIGSLLSPTVRINAREPSMPFIVRHLELENAFGYGESCEGRGNAQNGNRAGQAWKEQVKEIDGDRVRAFMQPTVADARLHVMVVGRHDADALFGPVKDKYDSNTSLAQRRAACIVAELHRHWPKAAYSELAGGASSTSRTDERQKEASRRPLLILFEIPKGRSSGEQ